MSPHSEQPRHVGSPSPEDCLEGIHGVHVHAVQPGEVIRAAADAHAAAVVVVVRGVAGVRVLLDLQLLAENGCGEERTVSEAFLILSSVSC